MTIIIVTIQFILITHWANCLFLVAVFSFKKNKFLYSSLPIFYIISLSEKSLILIPGLQNILSVIHPIIILGFYGVLLKCFLLKSYWVLNKLITCINITVFSLFLGGWWAFQEFTWGGWWNWDGVETPILLLIFFLIFVYFHLRLNSVLKLSLLIRFTHSVELILLIILLTRYGTLNSVHSFVQLESAYQLYWSLIMFNQYLLGFFFIIKLLSFWTFIFIKCYLIICMLFILKNMRYYAVLSILSYKLSQHKVYWLLSFLLVVFNFSYIEFNNVRDANLLVDYTTSQIFWKKPETFVVGEYFFHIKSLIN